MNKKEYLELTKTLIKVGDLKNMNDRTLIWGYDLERNSFHVYMKDDTLFKVVYSYLDILICSVQGESLDVAACIPSKRIYPEASDLEFCEILMKRGQTLPFTTFDEKREERQYHGLLLENLLVNRKHY